MKISSRTPNVATDGCMLIRVRRIESPFHILTAFTAIASVVSGLNKDKSVIFLISYASIFTGF